MLPILRSCLKTVLARNFHSSTRLPWCFPDQWAGNKNETLKLDPLFQTLQVAAAHRLGRLPAKRQSSKDHVLVDSIPPVSWRESLHENIVGQGWQKCRSRKHAWHQTGDWGNIHEDGAAAGAKRSVQVTEDDSKEVHFLTGKIFSVYSRERNFVLRALTQPPYTQKQTINIRGKCDNFLENSMYFSVCADRVAFNCVYVLFVILI